MSSSNRDNAHPFGSTAWAKGEGQSYISLCRELRLGREFTEGDHYAAFWNAWEGSTPPPKVTMWTNAKQDWSAARAWFDRESTSARDVAWLPRLDQWLAMLEEVGVDCPSFDRADEMYILWRFGMDDDEPRGEGPSREEAAGRLWMAVTGR
jgi:hypothetical protein